ncbi:MAG: TonB-dependent receptor [Rhodothermia bacterium]|nr:TonB-dependent receptor [Rhodothermia bacterium]
MVLSLVFAMTPLILFAQQYRPPTTPALADALRMLRSKSGLDLVFSPDILKGKYTSCAFDKLAPEAALVCILEGSGFVAKSIDNSRQWIVIPAPQTTITTTKIGTIPEVPLFVASGVVRDAQTGETLIGASITLEPSKRGATTDREGQFRIDRIQEKKVWVRASYVGYESVLTSVMLNGKPLEFRLTPSTTTLAPLVVDGNRSEGIPEKAIPGVLTLSSRQLEQASAFRGQEDLFQILDGFTNVGRTSEVNGDLIVRGAEENQTRYWVDDMPLFTPGRTFGGFSTPQPDLLQGVTLYRGLVPVEFGGRLASVLTTNLKEGFGSKPLYSIGLSQSSMRFSAEMPITSKISGMLALRHSIQDVLRHEQSLYIQQKASLQDISARYGYGDLTTKITFRPNRLHQFALNFYTGSDALQADGNASLFPRLQKNPQYANGFNARLMYGWQSHQAGLRYQYLATNRSMLSAMLYQSGYKMSEMNMAGVQNLQNSTVDAFQFFQRASYENSVTENGLKVKGDLQWGNHTTRLGLALTRYEFNSTLDAMPDYKQPLQAGSPPDQMQEKNLLAPNQANSSYKTSKMANEGLVFGEDVWQLGRLQLVPAFRLGMFESYSFFSPQLSARLVPVDRLVIKGGIGTQAQHLHTLRDRFGCAYAAESGNCTNIGRLYIRPSNGQQANIGAELSLNPNIRLDLDAYWRKSGNILVADRPYRVRDGLEEPLIEAGQQVERYIAGRNKAFGLESTAVWSLNRFYTATLGYVYGRSLYVLSEAERSLQIPARYDAPHSAHATLQFRNKGWLATLSGQVRSGYPVHTEGFSLISFTDPEKIQAVQGLTIERLHTYHRLDVSIGKRLFYKGKILEFTGQLLNFTNTSNDLDQHMDGTGGMYASVQGSGLKPAFNLKLSF